MENVNLSNIALGMIMGMMISKAEAFPGGVVHRGDSGESVGG